VPSDRIILRFSDGTSEWRQPTTVPEVGSTVTRGDQEWVVTEIESTTDELAVAILKRAPKQPRPAAEDEPADPGWPGPIEDSPPLVA
jgi:hypothetical protein